MDNDDAGIESITIPREAYERAIKLNQDKWRLVAALRDIIADWEVSRDVRDAIARAKAALDEAAS